MNSTIELYLLEIRSLIADKEMEVATANMELSKGGWLSDHQGHVEQINSSIESIRTEVLKYPST